MKKLTMIALGALVAVFGVTTAHAVPNSDTVLVNIEVLEEAQLWAGHSNVQLTLSGANAENSDAFQSSINYINNVDAKIDVEVDGNLPAPIVPGGGIQFFVFDNVTAADAVNTNIVANAYNPAGALAWNFASLGTSQELDANVGVNTSAVNRMITYAAAAPGELPLPDDFDLEVTFTISILP